MKSSITLGALVILFALPSMATTARCPRGYTRSLTCEADVTSKTSKIMQEFIEKAIVCKKGSESFLMIYSASEEGGGDIAAVTNRIGGTSYDINVDGMNVSLGIGGPNGTPNVRGTVYVDFGLGMNGQRDMDCEIK